MEKDVFDAAMELSKIYDKIGGELSIEKLRSLRPDIDALSVKCVGTELFKNSVDLHQKFIDDMKVLPDIEAQLVYAWNHLDERVESAPTTLHTFGAIILCTPILAHALAAWD